jgi:hypothetical protein
VVVVVVLVVALVVTLALPVFGPVLSRFSHSWVIGALFSSWLLFWSLVLFTGLVSAVVIIVAWRILKGRILKGRCAAVRRDGPPELRHFHADAENH